MICKIIYFLYNFSYKCLSSLSVLIVKIVTIVINVMTVRTVLIVIVVMVVNNAVIVKVATLLNMDSAIIDVCLV